MKLDKLTQKMSEAYTDALDMATKKSHSEATEEHLISAILSQNDGMAPILFSKLSLKISQFLQRTEEIISKLPRVSGDSGEKYPSRAFVELLKKSESARVEMKDEYLSTDHVLVTFMKESTCALKQEFIKLGLNYPNLLKAILELRKGKPIMDDAPEGKTEALKKYAKDLNALAKKGKIDPVIGRD